MSVVFGSQEANKILKRIKREEATHCEDCESEIEATQCLTCNGTGENPNYWWDDEDEEYDEDDAACDACDGTGDIYECDCGKYTLTQYELEYRIKCKQAVIS